MSLRWRLFPLSVIFLSLVLFVLTSLPAQAAGLLIADGPFGGRLAIEEHTVSVTVNNGIAVTEVIQVFRNTEDRTVEALYTFPVPKGASVADFSMWIEGREMVGEVLEKKRAREIYESYKQTRRDPGLLEQVDYKSFEMRIFPIGPQAEQRVRITYYQELEVDGNWATYVYPLATATRATTDSRVEGRFAFDFHIRSQVPITELESPSHAADFALAQHGESYRQASLEAASGDLARDVVVAAKMVREKTGFDLIATRPARNQDGTFLLTLTVGEELAKLDRGMDYVFVLDASGSMDQEGKLALSRDSLSAFLDALGEDDRFEVMAFNVAPQPLFSQLEGADDASKARGREFLGDLRARGGTFLMPALETAYRYKNPDRLLNVVILSDGMTEQREARALASAIQNRPAGTRVFAIGVGNEVNRPLLEQITQQSGGLAAFISRGDDFTRQARAFRRKLLRPAAANPEIRFEGGGITDLEPSELPDLFHGAPLRLYGRYGKAGPTRLHFAADVGGERIEHTIEIDLPASQEANPELERMWAWHRVDRLLKEADREGDRQPVIDEIVRLGEAFSIVTEYTSFLVLENDAEYQRWKIERRNALRFARDRRQQGRVAAELERLRQQARSELGPNGEDLLTTGDATEKDQAEKNGLRTREAPANREVTISNPGPSPTSPVARNPAAPPQQTARRDTSRDMSLGGGGGAMDPASLILALLLAGLTLGGAVLRRFGGAP